METKTVHSGLTNRNFTARILRRGDKYGLNDCLTWGMDKSTPPDWQDRLGVEFYDATYAGDQRFPPLGQFVSRYYLGSILGGTGGLDLQGDVAAWKISADAMVEIRAWAASLI